MGKIKLGVIRADTHAYYFGAMMNRPDPLLFQKNDYVCHHYFSDIYDPTKITGPRVAGFEIARVHDADRARAERYAETFLGKPQVCDRPADVCEGVDAVAVFDCDGSGADHLELAAPSLKKGLPTFVDKPFASTLEDAREIVRLARRHKAPLFNASILSHVPAADRFKSRFDEIRQAWWPLPQGRRTAPIGVGVVKGVGGAFSQDLSGQAVTGGIEDRMAYIIHGVSLALNLFGKGVEWVEAMGTLPLEYFHLHLESGCEVTILNTSVDHFPETCSFYASAYSKFGAVHSPPIGDPEFLGGGEKIVKLFKKMVATGKPPIAYEDFIEPIAVIEAGQIAQKEGKRVYLKKI